MDETVVGAEAPLYVVVDGWGLVLMVLVLLAIVAAVMMFMRTQR